MQYSNTTKALGRLFTLQHRSLPQYLLHASPHVRPGDEHIADAVRNVARQQEIACRRLADLILSRRGLLPNSTYPMRYTDTHYLDVRFLLSRLIAEQRHAVKEMEWLVEALKGDREAHELAEEIFGQEIGHAHVLEELRAGLEPSATRTAEAASGPQRANVRRPAHAEGTGVSRAGRAAAVADEIGVGA